MSVYPQQAYYNNQQELCVKTQLQGTDELLTYLWQWHRWPTNHPWRDDGTSRLYGHRIPHICSSIKIAVCYLLIFYPQLMRRRLRAQGVEAIWPRSTQWDYTLEVLLTSTELKKEGKNVVSYVLKTPTTRMSCPKKHHRSKKSIINEKTSDWNN